MRPSVALTLVLIGLFGCTNPYDREGLEPFECRDGADNDADGYYDCSDNGCWGSPDCEGVDTGHDTGSDTGNDTGSDTDTGTTDTDTATATDTATTDTDTGPDPSCIWPHCDFETVQIAYDLQWLPWDQMTTLGYADCTVHYVGTGNFVQATETRATFLGTWTLASHDCAEADFGIVQDMVWFDETGVGYHSFYFSDDTTVLDDWFAHKAAQGFTVESFNRWYITEVFASIDPAVAAPNMHWTFVEVVGDAWTDLGHDLTVTFGK